ncbi:MAG: CBS domain-containing protein [Rhodospirillales bacterium]|nr:CBS domain-containing protein [Rhodospirillales bacterium]
MPCSDQMIPNVVTISPQQTISEALELLHKHSIRTLPVVDEKYCVVGLFSFSFLLKNLLPMAVTLDDDMTHMKHLEISLDHLPGQAPWLAKRLKAHLPKKVEEVMLKNIVSVHPDTPLREGVRLIVKYGSPIPVIEKGTQRLLGLISSQSAIAALIEIMKTLDNGQDVHE